MREGNEESSEETTGCKACVYAEFDDCPRVGKFVKLLDFRHFERHFAFSQSDRKTYKKAVLDAFVEMFRLLAENFDDVLESVLMSVEEALSTDGSADKLKRIEKEIYNLETRRKKLTDMILDDKITKEAYDEKYEDLCRKLAKAESEKQMFSDSVITQNAIIKRMQEIRSQLTNADVMEQFDRIVFESIVEKIIVGETYEDGTVDPYKLTFVLKGMDNWCNELLLLI